MRKNVTRIIVTMLILVMVLQVFPLSVFTASASDATKPVVTDMGIKYVYYEDISTYRTDKSYPKSEGYVFGGWWTGITENDKDAKATVFSDEAETKSAWAKYVPEEVLTVKAQVSERVVSAAANVNTDGTLANDNSLKLRLVTSVDDSTKYTEVGFKVKVNKEITSAAHFYDVLTVREKNNTDTIEPENVFHETASTKFATLVIGGFNSLTKINETELSVTPYWKTLDGTTVYGTMRSRLLVSDDRASDNDGTDDLTEKSSVYTYNNNVMSERASYRFFEGASDTVYLKGTYTTTGSTNNCFGISIRNGGQTRQIYFEGVGVKIFANEGLTDVAQYNTMHHTDLIYVWTQSSTSSVVQDMLSTAGSYDVIWAIEKNVLYCSVAANGVSHVVFSIPMTKVCEDWKTGRYYQLGLAAYNSATQDNPLQFKVDTLKFGKDAKALLVTEANSMPLDAYMCYEPITGSYMAASKEGISYRYGVAATGAQAMKTTIHLANAAATSSSTGITVRKTDGQSAQILLAGSDKTARLQFDHQTVDAPIDITSIIPEEVTTYDANGACEVTVIVKEGTLYVQYNGVQAGSVALNKILEGYRIGDELQLGLFAWDPMNGLARFSDVEFITGDAVKDITTTDANWDTLLLTDEEINVSVDHAKGIIKDNTSNTISRVQFNGSDTTWEISGKLNRSDGTSNTAKTDIALMFEAEGKSLRIDACYQGIMVNDNNAYRHGDNALAFNQGIGSFFRYLTIAPAFEHTTDEIYFKFVVVDDRLYALFGADANNLVPSWNIPLDERIMGYNYDSGTRVGTYDENSTIFEGFTSGSSYKIKLYTFQDASVESTISNLIVNRGEMADTTVISTFPKFHTESIVGADVNAVEGTIANQSGKQLTTYFQDYSATWEITGQINRTDALTADPFCYGFDIKAGDKTLRFAAQTRGIVFDPGSSFIARYPYHAFGTSQYNFNTDISKFIQSPRTESTLYFRVVIANDTFYAWYGFDKDEMILSWQLPLASPLQGPNDRSNETIFSGFDSGSKYNLGFYVPATTGLGTYENLTVRTGDAVDLSFLTESIN